MGAENRYAHVPPGAYSVVAEVHEKPGKEAELRAARSASGLGVRALAPENYTGLASRLAQE
jgi:hypothetical protein